MPLGQSTSAWSRETWVLSSTIVLWAARPARQMWPAPAGNICVCP